MTEETAPKSGVIEGTSRVLRELMRTPRFRQTLRILLRELDPENVPALVRAVREEDPELFLSLLAKAPSFANIGIEGARELLSHIAAFPPDLLFSFLAEMADDLNGERLGETAALSLILCLRIAKNKDEGLIQAAKGLKKGFQKGFEAGLAAEGIQVDKEKWAEQLLDLGFKGANELASKLGKESEKEDSKTKKLVNRLAEGMMRIARDNPEFMDNVVHPLLEAGIDALALNDSKNGDDEDVRND